MAQGQVGMTESPHHAENLNVSHTGPSEIKDDDMRRAESDMSQSHTLTPSRGGTLKKRKSLTRKDSLKRSGSRKTSRPGSVRGLTFADDVDGQGSEMNSAFFTPYVFRSCFTQCNLVLESSREQNLLLVSYPCSRLVS